MDSAAVKVLTPEEKLELARKEAEELAADKERVAMWAEEERMRSLQAVLERYMRAHVTACARIQDTAAAARKLAALRASVSPQEVAKLRSPLVRKSLKADVKKSVGLSKRAIMASPDTLEGLLRDIGTTALGRYAGEIALDIGSSGDLRVGEF